MPQLVQEDNSRSLSATFETIPVRHQRLRWRTYSS